MKVLGFAKILGMDPTGFLLVAGLSSYLSIVAFDWLTNERSTTGMLFSIAKNTVRSGLTKIDDSLENYIDEKDEEIESRIKTLKRSGVRYAPKKEENEKPGKYEIFM